MSNLITQQVDKLASSFGLQPSPELYSVLKATAFKAKDEVSDAQLSALLIVANQYGLNPWTKEIYAYPDKNNGIVPVVGVDGWSRIVNNNPMLDGISFTYSDETVMHKGKTCHVWIDCIIHRKDRQHPIVVRELFEEVVRNANFATPWDTHPNRMHRHKVLIQCARLAFGFGGIYDMDEAERIIEATPEKAIDPNTGEIKPKAKPAYSDESFQKNLPAWTKLIEDGKKTADQIIHNVSLVAVMSEDQQEEIRKVVSRTVDMETAA